MKDIPTAIRRRIANVRKQLLKLDHSAALLVSSAASSRRSRDQDYPYSQDTDFLYLTGCDAPGLSLLITSNASKATLIAKQIDQNKIVWDGPGVNFNTIAEQLSLDLIATKNPQLEIKSRLSGVETLYHQNTAGTLSWEIANGLIRLPSHERGNYPLRFVHTDSLLEKMRLHKEALEVELIEKALGITFEAFRSALALVYTGVPESDLAATVDYVMNIQGAKPAFASIIAAGKNAATLHYTKLTSNLKNRDLVLFDIGASYLGYSGDITRVIPVSRIFDDYQSRIYNIVLSSQKAALRKIKHGVKIKSVFDAAAHVLTEGLIDLGVLRGKLSKLMENLAYKPYFPHGIGHSLGLDVHDIGRLRGNNEAILEEGMVFTVEPGLYFKNKIGHAQAGGVRIEDNVLVTRHGCKILSEFIPKEIPEVEELLNL